MSGGSKSQSVTQTVQPANAPYVREALDYAKSQFLNNPNDKYYPGQTYADISPQRLQALQAQEQMALQGSPEITAARSSITDILNQSLDQNNPALKAQLNAVIPQIESQYGRAGRTGGLAQAAKTEAIANAFGNQYNNMINQKLNAAQLSPGIYQSSFLPTDLLSRVGGQYEAQQMAEIEDALNRYNYNRDIGKNNAAAYAQIANASNLGSTSTTSQPLYRNIGAGILGGAGAGLQAASLFPGFGVPLAIGGGILGGLF